MERLKNFLNINETLICKLFLSFLTFVTIGLKPVILVICILSEIGILYFFNKRKENKKNIWIAGIFALIGVVSCLFSVSQDKIVFNLSVAQFRLIFIGTFLVLSLLMIAIDKLEFKKFGILFISLITFIIMQLLSSYPLSIKIFFFGDIEIKLPYLFNIFVVFVLIQFFAKIINPSIAKILIPDILFVIGIIEYFVYNFTGNHLSFQDISSIPTALSVAGNYNLSSDARLKLIFIIVLIIIANIIFISTKVEPISFKWSVPLLGIMVLFYIGIEFVLYFACEKFGFILYFPLTARNEFIKPYQYEVYQDYILDEYDKKEVETPNVIVIMSEAFSDLTVDGYEFSEDYMPFTRKIMEESDSGYIYSSVYGNNTVSTEFEFLTGITTLFSANGSEIYRYKINENIPSITNILKDYGYKTFGIHPYHAKGYNRNKAWDILGFDKTFFLEDFESPETIRELEFVSDKWNYEKILEIDKENKEPVFIFDVSMQNHAPYTDKFDKYGIKCTNSKDKTISNYANLAHETDEQLKLLIDYYKNSDEKTIIVLFGDHQPLMEKSPEVDTKFKVPCFIWSNYDTKSVDIDGISANYISSKLLEKMGIDDDWFNFVDKNEDNFPVISKSIQIIDNEIINNWFDYIKEVEDDDKVIQLKRYMALSYKYICAE